MNNTLIPSAPLFRDPIYDGAADPIIIWNRQEDAWWLLYTNRRASEFSHGVSFAYGTDIGVASSEDGIDWVYRGALQLEFEHGRNTFWAPEIIYEDGKYHMYVSYVKGIPTKWDSDKNILHYTSDNLWDWEFQSILKLSSKKVIDACVYKVSENIWKMWYKDEENNSYSYAAESFDLYNWTVIGPEITDCPHEGPNVFEFKGKKWMITDPWDGLGVYTSDDFSLWKRKKDILKKSGTRFHDATIANHADVLTCGENAYIFYFTHPELDDETRRGIKNEWDYNKRKTSIQVAKLEYDGENIVCDRDKIFELVLIPPST